MKIASVYLRGKLTFGAIVDSGFIDLGNERLGPGCYGLVDYLTQDLGHRAAECVRDARPECSTDELSFAPLVPNQNARIFAVGWAYRDHMAETSKDAPEHPAIFSKLSQSLVGHQGKIIKPSISDAFDYEGEIAVVIGSNGRNIQEKDAMSHIAGYTIMMDGSVRDWQKHSLTAGKNFDASSSLGPWLVTADEITDPETELSLTTWLNGQIVQEAPFSDNVWKLDYLIAYLSTFTELLPGDVISTGTPGGVGAKRNPPLFMKVGDVIQVDVRSIGSLRNEVAVA